ncbi:MAG: hypothetical protein QXD03_00045 [Candidatus Anstonellales archaeon]
MRAQASIEYMYYYIILLIFISIVIYGLFSYYQIQVQENNRYNLYLLEQYIRSVFVSASRLGPGGYVELDLPSIINFDSYQINLIRDNTDHTSARIYLNLNRSNYTYSFNVQTEYVFAQKNFNFSSGKKYIIRITYNNETMIEER